MKDKLVLQGKLEIKNAHIVIDGIDLANVLEHGSSVFMVVEPLPESKPEPGEIWETHDGFLILITSNSSTVEGFCIDGPDTDWLGDIFFMESVNLNRRIQEAEHGK